MTSAPPRNKAETNDGDTVRAAALRTIELEAKGIGRLAETIDDRFVAAVETLRTVRGRAIVTGMGKSGLVGRKIAATLASTGTPAQYVHPGEASHGDLGMITPDDAVLALSWSGETSELLDLLTYAKRFSIPLISLTSNADSALGRASDIVLELPKAEEACPHGLAPTTSTTMQLAMGDALAVALLESKGFTAQDFRDFHPGGKLGAMLRHVRDIMHRGEELPLVGEDMQMLQGLMLMSEKGFGCLGVVDADGRLIGIVTDGDLRRQMSPDLTSRTAAELMTRSPIVISGEMLASEALNVLNTKRITSLFVTDEGRPVGLVHLHDFLRAGVA